jgi:uncharacterized protein YvpB
MSRLTTIACGGVIGASLAGSFLLGPGRNATPVVPKAALAGYAGTLPSTGARRTGFGSSAPTTPQGDVYALELPVQATAAAPLNRPQPAPAAQPWAPPPGYVIINVPIYHQAMVLDCETSALRMPLASYGHYYSDAQLFSQENPDTRTPVMSPNHTVIQWGDPYTNFVGDVNGSDLKPTGYGVYWPVILSIARSHGMPNAQGGEGYKPATVYGALAARHPVEVWVETYWERPVVRTWIAWDGRTVRYSFIEHAVTLSGVSDTQVRVNDPLHGTQYWIDKSLFESNWRDFNDMAVIFQ